jgi:hypothetical protein
MTPEEIKFAIPARNSDSCPRIEIARKVFFDLIAKSGLRTTGLSVLYPYADQNEFSVTAVSIVSFNRRFTR